MTVELIVEQTETFFPAFTLTSYLLKDVKAMLIKS